MLRSLIEADSNKRRVNATASFGAELIEPCRQRLRDIWHQALQHGQERLPVHAAAISVSARRARPAKRVGSASLLNRQSERQMRPRLRLAARHGLTDQRRGMPSACFLTLPPPVIRKVRGPDVSVAIQGRSHNAGHSICETRAHTQRRPKAMALPGQ